MKPALALLILTYALAFCPRPLGDHRAPWERLGYVTPVWGNELRVLLDVALRLRDQREDGDP